jgi:hypothetical protein
MVVNLHKLHLSEWEMLILFIKIWSSLVLIIAALPCLQFAGKQIPIKQKIMFCIVIATMHSSLGSF